MIVMQVCAHHEIDFLRSRSGGGKALQVRQIEHVPEWPPGFCFVIAAARVDQDHLAADLQQPAVHGQPDQSCFGLVVMRRQPGLVLGDMRIGEFRKNIPRRIGREIGLLDARDGGIAYGEHRHLRKPIFFCRNSLV